MQYDPRTMRRLAMNLVVDELDRPIAFEADNKVLYPFPTLAADSFGDYTELVGPNRIYQLAPALTAQVSIYDISLGAESVLIDGGTEITSPYYDTTAESKSLVHPSLVYVPEGFAGYCYWLAITPYPASSSTYENPCIYASNDLVTWVQPSTNPIVSKPSDGYNADTHLYYHAADEKLYLMFTQRTTTTNRLMVTETSNGTAWSTPATVRSGLIATPQSFTSPSFWHDGTDWVCIFHNTDATPDVVQKMSSSDIYSWTGDITTVTITHPNSDVWWHSFFVRLSTGRVIGIMQDDALVSGTGASGGSLWLAQTDDLTNFSVRNIGTHDRHYRSTFIILSDENGVPDKFVGLFGEIVNGVAPNWRINLRRGLFGASDTRRTAAAVATQSLYSVNAFDEPWVLAVDGFTGSAGDLSATQDGKNWTLPTGDAIQLDGSGHATNENTSNCRALVDVGQTDYSVQVKFHTKPDAGQMWLWFRAVNTDNTWRVGWDTGEAFKLQSVVSGGLATNLTVDKTITAGDVIRVRCEGDTAFIYLNGQLVKELDMAGVHAAGDSVGIQAASATGCLFDDFVCHRL